MVSLARVYIWDAFVGAVTWDGRRSVAEFEFEPAFLKRGLNLSPMQMPIGSRQRIFSFPGLAQETFKGLPGLLADSLPDRFGSTLMDAWLARQGRDPGSVNPVERLCYMGRCGMGALEFEPAVHPKDETASRLEIASLIEVANEVLKERKRMKVTPGRKMPEAWNSIFRVGTSAGGARAKAIIAYNPSTGEVRSGQVEAPRGFSHCLVKFDGVSESGLSNPKGFGRIEYAYHRMALAAGISMNPCQLIEENGRAHFLTYRFDREGNRKVHMQTLCAMAHFDYNLPDAYSYEQAFQVMRAIGLPHGDVRELFTRMVFNVMARNQDDHTKNISFLMDEKGRWRLSPAYDVTYAHDPGNKWIARHQMSINGKRERISLPDLLAVAKSVRIKKPGEILEKIADALGAWPRFASDADIPKAQSAAIAKAHHLKRFQAH